MAMKVRSRTVSAPADSRSGDVAELWRRVHSGRRDGHYYVALFGMRRYDPLYVIAQVQRGLTYSTLERFQRNTEIPLTDLASIVEIPVRTLARRKGSGRLDPGESDRLVRLSRVFARAIELFEGDLGSAREWLTHPRRALGGRSALELAKTGIGAIEVENLIGRLEHGLPA